MADGTIRVAVRTRPVMMTEMASPRADIQYYGKDPRISLNDKVFAFDYVFPPNMTNFDVYNQAVSDRLQQVFDGYNVTILAFGQTGSGKTFTMGTNFSTEQVYQDYELGIIPRGVEDIFEGIKCRSHEGSFVVKVSFVEVYREDIFDLLSNRRTPLSLATDSFGPKVSNLTVATVHSAKEALQQLEIGARFRSTAATAMNEASSRSHAVFTVHVAQTKGPGSVSYSKFQLVDLAGSERPEAEGDRFREGININLGLLALGNVINALAERNTYIPYRDSKLTRLLSDSLGGNSITLIIACISPVDAFESMKTLQYAGRAKCIKNKPKLNVDPPEVQVEKLKEQVNMLQSQIYQMQMAGCVVGPSSIDSVDLMVKYENLRNELSSSSSRITQLTTKLIEAENTIEKYDTFKMKVELLCGKMALMIGKACTEESVSELSNILEEVKEIEYLCASLVDFEYRRARISLSQKDFEYRQPRISIGQQLSPPEAKELESPELLEDKNDGCSEQDGDDELSPDEITLKQSDIGREIVEIERSLSRKAQELEHIETICCSLEVPGRRQEDVNVMMSKIKALEKEREELAEALKKSEKSLLEERQKRYNQCQKEIKDLEAEVVKSQLMLKIKDQHKLKVEALQKEIVSLKQTRVKLVKKMKEEGDAFRKMQRAKDKEVAQLKQKDRKKEIEFAKKASQFEKQISVLKSRIDKANASKENLKKILQKKESRGSGDKSKKVDPKKVTQWIQHEVDVAVCQKIVDEDYNYAKEKAETLEEQIRCNEETAEQPADPGGKDHLKEVLELHKTRLSELKDMSLNLAGKSKANVWDKVNTVAEAKHGLEFLFNQCVSAQVNASRLRDELLEVQASMNQKYEENVKKVYANIETLEGRMEAMKNEYEEKFSEQEREYKKKTLELLKQINCLHSAGLESSNSNLQEILKFQEAEIARLSTFYEDYEKKCQEVEALQQRLLKAKKGKNIKWLGDITFSSRCDAPSETQGKNSSMLQEYLLDEGLEDSFGSRNDENDPDWRATPLAKRRKRPMRVLDSAQNIITSFSDSGDSIVPIKRSFSGCECPGDCKTMRCGCKKRDTLCSVSCLCNQERCINKFTKDS